jgi:hypothetical protein
MMINMRDDKLQTEGPLNSVEDKALFLYKKLLDIMERENSEIGKNRLGLIEHYMSQKIEVLREVEELTADKKWIRNAKTHEELSEIIKKIIDLNDANAHTVRKIKSEIKEELTNLHRSRSAFKAYNSQK